MPLSEPPSSLVITDDGTFYEFVINGTKFMQINKTLKHLEINGDFKARRTL
ncbi:MAG: hypothetical protein Q8O68_00460 [Candidatus Daviesbacteria bacterium]|nr:hypothetical protein [Candidatus Daviesbacteria bacterium]